MEFCQPVSRSTRVDLTVNGKSVGKVNELAALLGYEVKKLNRFTQKPCKELTDLTLIYRHTKTNPEQREALKTWARSETHSDLRRLAGEFLEEHGKSFWPTPEDPASPTDTLRYPRDSLLWVILIFA